MELINTLQPILLAIIAGLFGLPFLPLLSGRKMKKIMDAKTVMDLLSNEDDEHKAFLRSEIKEASFYRFSGIATNAASIPLYIALRTKLGGSVSWALIARAMPFLSIENDTICVKISERRRLFAGFGILLSYFAAIGLITFLGYSYLNEPAGISTTLTGSLP